MSISTATYSEAQVANLPMATTYPIDEPNSSSLSESTTSLYDKVSQGAKYTLEEMANSASLNIENNKIKLSTNPWKGASLSATSETISDGTTLAGEIIQEYKPVDSITVTATANTAGDSKLNIKQAYESDGFKAKVNFDINNQGEEKYSADASYTNDNTIYFAEYAHENNPNEDPTNSSNAKITTKLADIEFNGSTLEDIESYVKISNNENGNTHEAGIEGVLDINGSNFSITGNAVQEESDLSASLKADYDVNNKISINATTEHGSDGWDYGIGAKYTINDNSEVQISYNDGIIGSADAEENPLGQDGIHVAVKHKF